jgi:hypothetical protein
MSNEALNKVTRINWNSIPRTEWRRIIASLSVGQIIDVFPYQFPTHCRRAKVPVGKNIYVFEEHNRYYKVVDIYLDGSDLNNDGSATNNRDDRLI